MGDLVFKLNEAKAMVIAEGFEIIRIDFKPETMEQLKKELEVEEDSEITTFIGIPVKVREDIPENRAFIVRKKDIEEMFSEKQ